MQRFRLIPMVIFFAGLTLTVKLGALWQDMEIAVFSPAVAEPKAASEPAVGTTPSMSNTRSTA